MAPPTVRSSQSDSRQPSSPHAAPLRRCPPTPPPSRPNLVQEPRGRPAPSEPRAGRQTAPAPTLLRRRRGGSAARYARDTARAALTPPRLPAASTRAPGVSRGRWGGCLCPIGPRRSAFSPRPTTHLHRSRGSRRNSAHRAPCRGTKSGAGQRQGFVTFFGEIALSGRLAGRKRRAAFPGRPFPLPSCPPPPPPPLPQQLPPRCECFRLATESLPGRRACPVR